MTECKRIFEKWDYGFLGGNHGGVAAASGLSADRVHNPH